MTAERINGHWTAAAAVAAASVDDAIILVTFFEALCFSTSAAFPDAFLLCSFPMLLQGKIGGIFGSKSFAPPCTR